MKPMSRNGIVKLAKFDRNALPDRPLRTLIIENDMAKMIPPTGTTQRLFPATSICKGHPGRKAGPQSCESKVYRASRARHDDRPAAMTLHRLSSLYFM